MDLNSPSRRWWIRYLKILSPAKASFIIVYALATFLSIGAQGSTDLRVSAQQAVGSEDTRAKDTEERDGPFLIGGQNYTVVLRKKRFANLGDSATLETLLRVEIMDASGAVVYSKEFPAAIEQGRAQSFVSVSAQLISGKTGNGLLMRYVERRAASQTGGVSAIESWQLIGLVNDKIAPLGKPAQIGTAGAGGAFMGVMMRATNGNVSVISQPDTIEVRAWSGSLYAFIPLRVNWNHGGLAEGQRCMEMLGGGLREVGCDMRVEVNRKPSAEEYSFLRVFPEAHEDPEAVEHVVVQKDSKVEILGTRSIVTWQENGDLLRPAFSDLWLHVRVDQHDGWISGEEDFLAVGLPAGSPVL
jgi:hypothetical protein